MRVSVVGIALATAVSLTGCATSGEAPTPQPIDLLIEGGTVYDGSGTPGISASVAINDGEIVFIGVELPERFLAQRTIDANGMIVAPGFIDPHTHEEDNLATGEPEKQANLHYALQGVTTVMVGNDGFGFPDFREVSAPLPAGTNYAFMSGFGDIRQEVMGMEDRAATPEERQAMAALVRRDMCAGAFGFSTSLRYAPQIFAETDEVVGLARVAGQFGGYYDSHIRDESDYTIGVLAALEEAITIGKQGDLPVHISHIKALGPPVWGKSAEMIAIIEAARASGQRVTADQYPWEASGTRVSRALVPAWALEGGLETLRGRLGDPETLDQIRSGMAENLVRRGGAERLLLTRNLHQADFKMGLTLAEFAAERDQSPIEAALSILEVGDARLASFVMDKRDMAAFTAQDWVVTGSDGSTGHPRKFASLPKAYRDLVVDGDMPLARFIQRSSGQTADIIGLSGRGYLKLGYAADLVIFDPEEFAPKATYQSPEEFSVGVRYLVVNGELVIGEGAFTGNMSGKALLKPANCN